MPKTIKHLKPQAAAARQTALEREEVLKKLRDVISAHGFTSADLYPKGRWPGDVTPSDDVEELPLNVVRLAPGKTYRDAEGNVWNGRGRRPKWLSQALDGGAVLADFLVG